MNEGVEGELITRISTLWWLRNRKRMGRYRLQRMLNLSEGLTRALLKKYIDEDLIKAEQFRGCMLTRKGTGELKRLLSKLKIWKILKSTLPGFTIEYESFLFHLRGLADNINYGLEQRDAAVRLGAEGAITFLYTDVGLLLPIGENMIERQPEGLHNFLLDKFDLKTEDIIILCFAGDEQTAFRGGLAASLAANKKTKNIQQLKYPIKIAKIEDDKIGKIQKLEKELDIYLVAYEK